MISNILSLLYLCAYLAAGQFMARALFAAERPLFRWWMGGVFSLLLLLWLPALFGFLFGFTVLAQLLALLVCAAAGLFAFLAGRKKAVAPAGASELRPALMTLLPLFLLGGYLFLTHILRPVNGALHSGQSTFGDLPLHLGLVTSIARQGTFPPQYSIFPGMAVGYPFLCDSISATFYVLGASLRFSMLLPARFAYALVLLGVYCFFLQWQKKTKTAVFSTLLFFLGGGFGFWYFLDLWKTNPDAFTRIFTGFYNTPTNLPDIGLRWVNPIADMLIPQRATLFGWALLFPALYLLRRAAFEREPKLFVPLGVIAGCMPLVHTHSFLALGMVSAVYVLYAFLSRQDKATLSGWVKYGLITMALALPQLILFTFRQSGEFLQPHFNWGNETDSYLWFYIKNLGLVFLLLPVAFFRLPKDEKVFYGGAVLIWFFSEFILFQPNPYDNNKLLFVWFAFTCGIVGKLLTDLYDRLSGFAGRRYLAALTLCALFLSGTLTLAREAIGDYEQFSADEAAAADYISEGTAPDALFLTATNHNNAVSSLTGRNILCGTGSYLYYHGLDYETREQQVRLLFEQPEVCFGALRETYGIDYVFVSNYERYTYEVDEGFFSRFPIVYENDTVTIYDVRG
ncbi:MAG TPA: hypothetical protein VN366_03980 [Feifaniaceae bacterium]|nr:hypothetical protein [Feifaniaceae bacterium]